MHISNGAIVEWLRHLLAGQWAQGSIQLLGKKSEEFSGWVGKRFTISKLLKFAQLDKNSLCSRQILSISKLNTMKIPNISVVSS